MITKQYCVREPISAKTRLQICLRFLASGDSMTDMSYAFWVAQNTISIIIRETCEAIWLALNPEVFVTPSEANWRRIAREFDEKWDFPNCIGAIGDKHVVIQVNRNLYMVICFQLMTLRFELLMSIV